MQAGCKQEIARPAPDSAPLRGAELQEAALELHFEAPRMATFRAAMGTLGVKGMKVQRDAVSHVEPLR